MGATGWFGMVVLWLAVVALAVWAVTRLFPGQTGGDARATLDGRLARGEIDAETYRLVRTELDGLHVAREGERDARPPVSEAGGRER